MRRFTTALLGLLVLLCSPSAQAQTQLSGDADGYGNGFFGANRGSGFGTLTVQANSGGDLISEDLASDSDEKSLQGFAMFTTGSGGTTVSRALDMDPENNTRYRIRFKMEFRGMNTRNDDAEGTGVVLTDTEPSNQGGDVYAGEKIFVGIDGTGAWVYGDGKEFISLGDGNGSVFPANGGSNSDVYEIINEVVPRDGDGDATNGDSDIRVNNLSTNASSAIATTTPSPAKLENDQ